MHKSEFRWNRLSGRPDWIWSHPRCSSEPRPHSSGSYSSRNKKKSHVNVDGASALPVGTPSHKESRRRRDLDFHKKQFCRKGSFKSTQLSIILQTRSSLYHRRHHRESWGRAVAPPWVSTLHVIVAANHLALKNRFWTFIPNDGHCYDWL